MQRSTGPGRPSIRKVPQQARSRARFEAILHAATSLIARGGAESLKMSDVAAEAGISIGSLYQYFPDKTSLIHTLADRKLQEVGRLVETEFADIDSPAGIDAAVDRLVDDFYRLFLSQPALRDIWYGMLADKALQGLDLEDSRAKTEIVFGKLHPLLPPERHEELRVACFLILHLAGAAVRMAIAVPREEGDALMEAYKTMIKAQLRQLFESPPPG